MGSKRVVITGLGAITPIGKNINEYQNSLFFGLSGCENIVSFDTSKFKTKFACEVKNYDPLDYFDRKESRKMDMYTQFGMIAAEEAVNDSELNLENIDLSRIGVIWGSGVGGIETFQNELINFSENDKIPRFNPFFIPKLIPDICPGLIAIKYGFKGPNFATVSACASASNAIIDSYNYIKSGTSDIIITGGSESAVNETGVGGFNAMKALSERNDSPKTASRPFDKERDGFVLGEGGGAIILEDYDHAIKRNAKIYAEVIGFGMSCDAHHITAPSKDMPPVIPPSPITAMCCLCMSLLSFAAIAIPNAAEIEVEEWPTPNVSYSLSEILGKPDSPLYTRLVWKLSFLPVNILCP